MLDLTDLKTQVRNFLLADASLSTSVSSRIYFANLFTLVNPVFPCVNIELFEGRNINPAVDRMGLNVFCSSKTSQNEADMVWDLLNAIFANAHIGQKMIVRPQITPINRIDKSLNFPVYQNISRYIIHYIG